MQRTTDTVFITIDRDNMDQAAEEAGKVIREGGIVAFPTDTVYGLGAACFDAQAVRRIFEAKGRPENKPLSILVSGPEQVKLLADHIPEDAYRLMRRFWPGALTLIFPVNPEADIPQEVTAGGSTIGLRMPDNTLAVRIIEAAGVPLAAPSANASGKRSSVNAREVCEDLFGKADMILDAGTCPVGISSTVLDISGDPWKILREGSITRQEIEQVIERSLGEKE